MDVTPLVKEGAQVIQSYSGGRFRVSGALYDGAVVVSQDQTVSWDVSGFDDLSEADFEMLIVRADDIDVVLLGCGAQMKFLNPELKKVLRGKGLSVDTMDTGAACRTYNVLMAEGRWVVAALLPV